MTLPGKGISIQNEMTGGTEADSTPPPARAPTEGSVPDGATSALDGIPDDSTSAGVSTSAEVMISSQDEMCLPESMVPVEAAEWELGDAAESDADPGADAGDGGEDDEFWAEWLWLHPDRDALLRKLRRRRRRATEAGLEPFTVLADPVRATIVELLCSGSTTAGDIASAVHDRHGVGWSSVSRHLAVLRAAGFALDWADPPRRFWYLTDDWLDHLRESLAAWEARWRDGAADRDLGHVAELVERGLLPAVGLPPGVARRRGRGRRGRGRSAYGDGRSGNGPDDDGGHGLD